MANDTRTPLGQGCGAAGFGVQRDPALQGDRSTQELPAAAAGSGPLRGAPSPPGGGALPGSPALVPPGSLLGCLGGSREVLRRVAVAGTCLRRSFLSQGSSPCCHPVVPVLDGVQSCVVWLAGVTLSTCHFASKHHLSSTSLSLCWLLK